MTLDSVTSLADLAFKAKTNKYYRKLVILTAQWLGYPDATTYELAMDTLYRVAHRYNPNDCLPVVRQVNNRRSDIKEDPEPVVTPTVDELIKQKKTDKIVEELKKKDEHESEENSPWIDKYLREEYELRRSRYEQLERERYEQRNRWYRNSYGNNSNSYSNNSNSYGNQDT